MLAAPAEDNPAAPAEEEGGAVEEEDGRGRSGRPRCASKARRTFSPATCRGEEEAAGEERRGEERRGEERSGSQWEKATEGGGRADDTTAKTERMACTASGSCAYCVYLEQLVSQALLLVLELQP